MIETVKTLLFSAGGTDVYHECRRCGTNVDSADVDCPKCGSGEIASVYTR